MDMIKLGDVTLHYRIEGDADGLMGSGSCVSINAGMDCRAARMVIMRLMISLQIPRGCCRH